jgi:sigma-54-specific transcriptional regulator
MAALDAALIQLFEHPPANLYACIEEAVIRAAYRYCHRNQLQTARLLAISRNVVRARLIQYGELPSATLRPDPAESRRRADARGEPPASGPSEPVDR